MASGYGLMYIMNRSITKIETVLVMEKTGQNLTSSERFLILDCYCTANVRSDCSFCVQYTYFWIGFVLFSASV